MPTLKSDVAEPLQCLPGNFNEIYLIVQSVSYQGKKMAQPSCTGCLKKKSMSTSKGCGASKSFPFSEV